jgi:release factor glutamine methyltransferase
MNARSSRASSVESLALGEALQQGATRLSQAGIESPRLDAEVLLRHLLGLERDALFLRLKDPLSLRDQERFRQLLERRAAREPLAYISGHKEFWSLDFMVTPAVLIPRPETELLVELALHHVPEYRGEPVRILDIGTGSGAIAVSLALHLPESEVWGVDISAAALRIAELNAQRQGIERRMRFFQGDLFDALKQTGAIFDLIVANPPYIRSAELAVLAPEIREWEPPAALDGGTEGIDFYPRIIGAAPGHLAERGRVLLEIGSDQADSVVDLFAGAGGYLPASVYPDCAGHDRVVAAVKGTGRG